MGVSWNLITIQSSWPERSSFSVVVLGDSMFLMGGFDGKYTCMYICIWDIVRMLYM